MIFHYFIKVFISSGIIVLVSEIAKRDNLLGGLVASIPLLSVLSMIWLYGYILIQMTLIKLKH